MATSFSIWVPDLLIWDKELRFHPAHSIGGDACAMESSISNYAISAAGSSCVDKPISGMNGCRSTCIWTSAPPLSCSGSEGLRLGRPAR